MDLLAAAMHTSEFCFRVQTAIISDLPKIYPRYTDATRTIRNMRLTMCKLSPPFIRSYGTKAISTR